MVTRKFVLIPSARHRDPASLVKIHVRNNCAMNHLMPEVATERPSPTVK